MDNMDITAWYHKNQHRSNSGKWYLYSKPPFFAHLLAKIPPVQKRGSTVDVTTTTTIVVIFGYDIHVFFTDKTMENDIL